MRRITPPTIDDMARMAEEAMADLPADLLAPIEGVAIRVEEFPDDATVAEMELDGPFDLLGLYVGTPFGEKRVGVSATHVDIIFLYRQPILAYWCETGEDLHHVVRHVLIHEIGHHYGFSDEDMERLETMEP